MYRNLDAFLAKAKKKLRTEFNRIGVMGFDELNVVNTKKLTKEMFDRLLSYNETMYLRVAEHAYDKAVKTAEESGYEEEETTEINKEWLIGALLGYNLVTGYLYDREAERKRLRLNEQILTAREYDNRQMFNDGLRRTSNLWWTQTMQYGIDIVDKATLQAFKDLGVEKVRWIATVDKKTCKVCKARNNKIYKITEVPEKAHYSCRCYLEPVTMEE